MANAKQDTGAIIEELGGKKVWCPKKLSTRHVRASKAEKEGWPEKHVLLLAILSIPYGDYLKEVSSPQTLTDCQTGLYAASYYEISKETLAALKSHPRAKEIFS